MAELDIMEEPDPIEERISEDEDFALSDNEDKFSVDQNIVLSIDSNGRIVTKEAKWENAGDDCDMRFVDKNLSHRGSDADLCTSTEDLNISDEEGKSSTVSAFQSINLDGVAGGSTTKNVSLSTLNYSRTVLKTGNADTSERIADDEAGHNSEEEIFLRKNKCKAFPPGLTVAGHPSSTSLLHPTQKSLNSLNRQNIYANSLLLDEALHDVAFHDEQESLPMTCMEFLKSEISDNDNTDAEDISMGSAEDVREIAEKKGNPFENGPKSSSIPVSFDSLLSGNIEAGSEKRLSYPGDGRRSSVDEIDTEDEAVSLENFSGRCRKRVKKRSFAVADKNGVSGDSDTDEELLDDQ